VASLEAMSVIVWLTRLGYLNLGHWHRHAGELTVKFKGDRGLLLSFQNYSRAFKLKLPIMLGS